MGKKATYIGLQKKKKQEAMLKALKEHSGLITHACKATGIARQTHYDWMNTDEDYRKAILDVDDYVLDLVEESTLDMIKEKKHPALNIFYLKCKGKKRGYREKQEIEISTGDMTSLRNLIKECDGEYEQEY